MIPKMTANKLGEYLTAGSRRRKTIIKTMKQEQGYPAQYYSDARAHITSYLSGEITQEELENKASSLKSFQSENPNTTALKVASGNAIDTFIEYSDDIQISNCIIKKGSDFENHQITINGILVTAKPDLILMDTQEKNIVGCIKFSFSQSGSLKKEAAEFTATIMKKYIEEKLSPGNKIDTKKVLIIDNPTGEIYEAPKSHTTRMKEVVAACEEISDRWEKIS